MKAICFQCKKELPYLSEEGNGTYKCPCGSAIHYSHRIYRFIETDNFYEGMFTDIRREKTPLRKFINTIERWISIDGNEERIWEKAKRYIAKNTTMERLKILNIGSGGGHEFLNKLGSVTAVDLSLQSLINAQNIYDHCYQADAQRLPFPDESFDIVFSAHLLGHIPLEQKQKVIKEIYRVTKRGGFSLHSVECEASNIIYKKAKKYPDLYKKYFQDMYRHYGLEYPSLCKKRFRAVGFQCIFEISDYCKGIVRPANSYMVFFGAKEYSQKEPVFFLLALLSRLLSFNKATKLLAGVILYPLTIINRFLGPDSVDSVKLLYYKN